MSIISEKTEPKAIVILARMVKQFEKLNYLEMTKQDNAEIWIARKVLQGIITANGYKVNHDRTIPRSIIKLKK
ncbi:hypothetical protein [Pedobacter frigoris]|uniref:hypothetical protein n=1 Tax=Pedobacter frigoris TaxID=2571272 RepID=UPI00292E631A|nr:hypothetical protein [Pedobacter frigoris]